MLLAAILALLLPDAAIRGTVHAEGTREPITHAMVQIPEIGRTVHVDERGYFVVSNVRAGRWQIRASAPGYLPRERHVEVPVSGTLELSFQLAPQPVEVAEIEVRGERGSRAMSGAGPGATRLGARDVDLAPALAEADVLRTVQTLPSVAAVSDFSSALYVRGGSPDQNLILLDGAPLFNPYHLGGIFGAIDPDAVAGVDVLPGAFPARVGDRLSSVIDIQTRDGGRDRVRGFGGTSLISTRAGMDGPLPGGRGSYLFSARRTYLDLFAEAAYRVNLVDFTLPYAFSDGHLKLTHEVGKLGRVSASLYANEEGLGFPRERPDPADEGRGATGDARFDWGSRLASLSYRQPLGPTLLGELRVALSSFHGSFDAWDTDYTQDFTGRVTDHTLVPVLSARSTMRDVLAGADLTWYTRRHQVRTGVQLDRYLFDYDVSLDRQDFGPFVPEFRRTDRPQALAAYVEDEWTPARALQVRGGLRVLHAGEWGTEWLPRVGAQYAVSPSLTLSLGAGRSAQVLHSLRNEESLGASLVAYDLLAAVPKDNGLTTAHDVVAGAEWASDGTSVRVDAYAKRVHDLPLAPLPEEMLEAPVVVAEGFRRGEMTTRGVELLARHARGAAVFSLAYALTFAEVEVDGERYTPRFERRHALDALAALPLGGRGQFSARLAVASGQPYTPAAGIAHTRRYDPLRNRFTQGVHGSGYTVLLGEHNSARLPGYFRLDVGARKSFDRTWFGRPLTFTPYLQIINVLNTPNTLAGNPRGYGASGPEVEYAPQLPIFPTFGIEWTF